MKHLNLTTQIAFLMLSASTMFGQSVQKGFVYEYNEQMQKVPLSNVEIVVTNAASTVSDEKGEFVLRFRQLKPGDRIMVRRCIKPGYSIADETMLDHLYITGEESQISILLCPTEKLMEIRQKMVRQANEKAALRYEDDQHELSISLKQKKITQEEYDKKLSELTRQYEAKLDNIENYVDRFVKLDLTALTAEEQRIMGMVRDGDFDKAIAAYDKLDLSGRLILQNKNVDRLEKASQSLTESERRLQEQRKSLRNSVIRQANLLRMEGGKSADAKIDSLLHQLVLVDTTNCYNVLVYARLKLEQSDFDGAYHLYESLRHSSMSSGDSLSGYLAQCYMAYTLAGKHYYQEAMSLMEKSLPTFDSLRRSATDTLNMLRDESEFCGVLGNAYARIGDYDRADQNFRRALQYLYNLRVETKLKDLDMQYATLLSQAAVTMRAIWSDKSVQYCHEAISILEELYQKQPHNYDGRLGLTYRRLGSIDKEMGKNEESETAFLESENYFRKAAERDPKTYRHSLANTLFCLGDLYSITREYTRALQCLDEATDIYKGEPDGERLYAETLSEINYDIGRCAYLMGDYQRALQSNLKALDDIRPLYQAEPEVYRKQMGKRLLHLCNVYIQLKDYRQAEYYIKRAAAVNPTSSDIQRHVKQVNDLLNQNPDSIK